MGRGEERQETEVVDFLMHLASDFDSRRGIGTDGDYFFMLTNLITLREQAVWTRFFLFPPSGVAIIWVLDVCYNLLPYPGFVYSD